MSLLGRMASDVEFQDPSWYRTIFSNPMMAPMWLIIRTYIGWQWLNSGWGKVSGDNWINNDGVALRGFWVRITAIPEQGSPPIRYDWYRDFIQFMLDREWYTWFAWVIAFGEVAVGIGLIIGMLTGLAALAGVTMNFNFMLAGTASTNPVLFLLGILVLLAWKISGRIGIDRWLLPALGTPWQAGTLIRPPEEMRTARG